SCSTGWVGAERRGGGDPGYRTSGITISFHLPLRGRIGAERRGGVAVFLISLNRLNDIAPPAGLRPATSPLRGGDQESEDRSEMVVPDVIGDPIPVPASPW